MFCPKCGREIPDSTEFCPVCGNRPGDRPAADGKGLAIASLVLALVGLTTAAFVTGIIALVERKPGRSMALAGVIIAAARLMLAIFLVVAMVWLAAFGIFVAAAKEAGNKVSSLSLPDVDEECDGPWCFSDDDTELNIDTTYANQAEEFIEAKEAEIAELEERVGELEDAEPGSGEAAEALLVAGYHLRRARRGLEDLASATGSPERVELMDAVEQHICSARQGMDSVSGELVGSESGPD